MTIPTPDVSDEAVDKFMSYRQLDYETKQFILALLARAKAAEHNLHCSQVGFNAVQECLDDTRAHLTSQLATLIARIKALEGALKEALPGLERIERSHINDMSTLHPSGCAQVASEIRARIDAALKG